MGDLAVQTYLDLVRRSEVIEPERLNRALSEMRELDSLDQLVSGLVRRRLLTSWQHAMLCKGLWRGFFLGRYKLLRELGCGGMSSVYLAEHKYLRRRVAIKVLQQKRAANKSHLTRFYRESRATAALDHPNVVRVFDFDIDGKFHYMVMEYVSGSTLQALVDNGGAKAMNIDRAIGFMGQAAAGLAHAHSKGLVHRDVKPGNLLVSKAGVIKISDFGLTKICSTRDTSLTVDDGSVLGTVDYLAPEQAMDSHEVDPRADVYSLGCTLYFALTGQPPFSTGTMAVRLMNHQTKPVTPLTEVRPGVPALVSELCQAMLAKKPDDRPTAAEVYDRLRPWIMVQDALLEGHSVLEPSERGERTDEDTMSAHLNASSSTIVGQKRNEASDTLVDHNTPADDDDKLTVNCPDCHTLLVAPSSFLGGSVACPECDSVVELPGLPSSAEDAQLPR
jgi:serine/threonine-protein kinase